jgi:hypothetical protein
MIEKLKRCLIVLFLLSPIPCSLCPSLLAQQPTSTAPLFEVNSHYLGGRTWADYKASAGAGLTLNIAAGTAYCGDPPAPVTYAGGTLTMTASQTNYVYLDPAAACVPAFNITGFAVGQIPLAKVVTGSSTITSVTDVRTCFVDPNSSGPVIRADLTPGADAGAKIAAAIAALPATGGTVDARGLEGPQTISATVTLGASGSKPVKMLLGAATFATSVCPAFDLINGGSVLEGLGNGAPGVAADGNSTTTIRAVAGCAGPLIRSAVLSGGGGGEIRRLRLDENGIATTGVEYADNPIGINIMEDVTVFGGVTAFKVGSNGENFRWNRLRTADVSLGIDLSAGNVRSFVLRDSTIYATSRCFLIGPDDLIAANKVKQVDFLSNTFILQASGLDVGLVRNAESFTILGGWVEVLGGLAPTSDSMIVLGTAASRPNKVDISHVMFTGNNSIAHAVEFFAVDQPSYTFNRSTTLTGSNLKVTDVATGGVVFGNGTVTNPATIQGLSIYCGGNALPIPCTLSGKLIIGASIESLTAMNLDLNSAPGAANAVRVNRLGGTGGFKVYQGGTVNENLSITDAGVATIRERLISTLATGTAPLVVASTTPVANLSLSGGAGTSVSVAKLSTPVNIVAFSATPTFDASLGNTQKITLTDNVTSSTLSNATAGQTINFIICQDATGGRTFVWPTNVKGGMTIGATLSKCSAQDFIFDGTNAYAVSAGVTNM